jgi:hypothetical protein
VDLIESVSPFCFNYTDFGQDNSLFVRASIYDVTTGTAVFVSNVVMTATDPGMYSGAFTATSGKTYLIISMIYTDGTYATPDPNRSASARCFQVMGNEVLFWAFNYVTFNQLETLPIAFNLYDVSTGTPVFVEQVAMAHVALGVYLGTYTMTLLKTYQALMVVYTDNTYTAFDTLYAPGCESFQATFGTRQVIFELSGGTVLKGQSLNAKLSGQLTAKVLKGQNVTAQLMGTSLNATLKGQNLKAILTGE